MKIAVVAPSNTLSREAADRVCAIAAERGTCELAIDPQCFLSRRPFRRLGRRAAGGASPGNGRP